MKTSCPVKTAQASTRARPSLLCMYEAGQMAGEIPLVGRQLPKAVIAAVRRGVTIDQFIADAISEKIGAESSVEIPKRAGSPALRNSRRWDIYEAWQLVADKALAVIQDLHDAYWNAIDRKDNIEKSIADGRIGLALDVMNQLQECKKATDVEHQIELRDSQLGEQRRAA